MIDEKLKEMVEDTVMIITSDLPSLLQHEETYEIRRHHKDEILKNIPEALTAIYEIGLTVIGADFDLPEMSIAHTTDGRIISGEEVQARVKIANDLKAAQRRAWAKACGVAEK